MDLNLNEISITPRLHSTTSVGNANAKTNTKEAKLRYLSSVDTAHSDINLSTHSNIMPGGGNRDARDQFNSDSDDLFVDSEFAKLISSQDHCVSYFGHKVEWRVGESVVKRFTCDYEVLDVVFCRFSSSHAVSMKPRANGGEDEENGFQGDESAMDMSVNVTGKSHSMSMSLSMSMSVSVNEDSRVGDKEKEKENIENENSASHFHDKENVPVISNDICILHTDSLTIITSSGHTHSISLPFSVASVHAMPLGIVLVKKKKGDDVAENENEKDKDGDILEHATKSGHSTTDSAATPVLFSLMHPLNEIKPICIANYGRFSHSADARYAHGKFVCDESMKVLHVDKNWPYLVTYSGSGSDGGDADSSLNGVEIWVIRGMDSSSTSRLDDVYGEGEGDSRSGKNDTYTFTGIDATTTTDLDHDSDILGVSLLSSPSLKLRSPHSHSLFSSLSPTLPSPSSPRKKGKGKKKVKGTVHSYTKLRTETKGEEEGEGEGEEEGDLYEFDDYNDNEESGFMDVIQSEVFLECVWRWGWRGDPKNTIFNKKQKEKEKEDEKRHQHPSPPSPPPSPSAFFTTSLSCNPILCLLTHTTHTLHCIELVGSSVEYAGCIECVESAVGIECLRPLAVSARFDGQGGEGGEGEGGLCSGVGVGGGVGVFQQENVIYRPELFPQIDLLILHSKSNSISSSEEEKEKEKVSVSKSASDSDSVSEGGLFIYIGIQRMCEVCIDDCVVESGELDRVESDVESGVECSVESDVEQSVEQSMQCSMEQSMDMSQSMEIEENEGEGEAEGEAEGEGEAGGGNVTAESIEMSIDMSIEEEEEEGEEGGGEEGEEGEGKNGTDTTTLSTPPPPHTNHLDVLSPVLLSSPSPTPSPSPFTYSVTRLGDSVGSRVNVYLDINKKEGESHSHSHTLSTHTHSTSLRLSLNTTPHSTLTTVTLDAVSCVVDPLALALLRADVMYLCSGSGAGGGSEGEGEREREGSSSIIRKWLSNSNSNNLDNDHKAREEEGEEGEGENSGYILKRENEWLKCAKMCDQDIGWSSVVAVVYSASSVVCGLNVNANVDEEGEGEGERTRTQLPSPTPHTLTDWDYLLQSSTHETMLTSTPDLFQSLPLYSHSHSTRALNSSMNASAMTVGVGNVKAEVKGKGKGKNRYGLPSTLRSVYSLTHTTPSPTPSPTHLSSIHCALHLLYESFKLHTTYHTLLKPLGKLLLLLSIDMWNNALSSSSSSSSEGEGVGEEMCRDYVEYYMRDGVSLSVDLRMKKEQVKEEEKVKEKVDDDDGNTHYLPLLTTPPDILSWILQRMECSGKEKEKEERTNYPLLGDINLTTILEARHTTHTHTTRFAHPIPHTIGDLSRQMCLFIDIMCGGGGGEGGEREGEEGGEGEGEGDVTSSILLSEERHGGRAKRVSFGDGREREMERERERGRGRGRGRYSADSSLLFQTPVHPRRREKEKEKEKEKESSAYARSSSYRRSASPRIGVYGVGVGLSDVGIGEHTPYTHSSILSLSPIPLPVPSTATATTAATDQDGSVGVGEGVGSQEKEKEKEKEREKEVVDAQYIPLLLPRKLHTHTHSERREGEGEGEEKEDSVPQKLALTLVQERFGSHELSTLPYSLHLPILQVLSQYCAKVSTNFSAKVNKIKSTQSTKSQNGLPPACYVLIGREDIAANLVSCAELRTLRHKFGIEWSSLSVGEGVYGSEGEGDDNISASVGYSERKRGRGRGRNEDHFSNSTGASLSNLNALLSSPALFDFAYDESVMSTTTAQGEGRVGVGGSVGGSGSGKVKEVSRVDGTELSASDVLIRFGKNSSFSSSSSSSSSTTHHTHTHTQILHTIHDVQKMLCLAIPHEICVRQSVDMSDHVYLEAQKEKLAEVVLRQLSSPIGRGMLTLHTTQPIIAETLAIPGICIDGLVPAGREGDGNGNGEGKAIRIQLSDTLKLEDSALVWPQFNNGVASALKVGGSSSVSVSRTWILYNKPKIPLASSSSSSSSPSHTHTQQLHNEHAGLLFGLGLQKHLKSLLMPDIFEYLYMGHETTTVALLLGLGASRIGTRDANVTKTLSIHIGSMSLSSLALEGSNQSLAAATASSGVDLEVPSIVQSSALVSLGLLYFGSGHRRTVEVLLKEIGREPTYEKEVASRGAHSVCAGLGLGMVLVGCGRKEKGKEKERKVKVKVKAKGKGGADSTIESQIRHFIFGAEQSTLLFDEFGNTLSTSTSTHPHPHPHTHSYPSAHLHTYGLDSSVVGELHSNENRAHNILYEGDGEGAGVRDGSVSGSSNTKKRTKAKPHTQITAPGSILALALYFLKSENRNVANSLLLPSSPLELDSVYSEYVCIRVWGYSLIMWGNVKASIESVERGVGVGVWGGMFLPRVVCRVYKAMFGVDPIIQSGQGEGEGAGEGEGESDVGHILQIYIGVLTGIALSQATIFAGSQSPKVRTNLCRIIDELCKLKQSGVIRNGLKKLEANRNGKGNGNEESSTDLKHAFDEESQTKLRTHVENTVQISLEHSLRTSILSLCCVMSGSGDMETYRIVKTMYMRLNAGNSEGEGEMIDDSNYGNHMVTHMSLGLLFLGCGQCTLTTSDLGVVGLVCTLFPLFPKSSSDNDRYLECLRHFYVLSTERRCIQCVDVDCGPDLNSPLALVSKSTLHYSKGEGVGETHSLLTTRANSKYTSCRVSVLMRSGERIEKVLPDFLPDFSLIDKIFVGAGGSEYFPYMIDFECGETGKEKEKEGEKEREGEREGRSDEFGFGLSVSSRCIESTGCVYVKRRNEREKVKVREKGGDTVLTPTLTPTPTPSSILGLVYSMCGITKEKEREKDHTTPSPSPSSLFYSNTLNLPRVMLPTAISLATLYRSLHPHSHSHCIDVYDVWNAKLLRAFYSMVRRREGVGEGEGESHSTPTLTPTHVLLSEDYVVNVYDAVYSEYVSRLVENVESAESVESIESMVRNIVAKYVQRDLHSHTHTPSDADDGQHYTHPHTHTYTHNLCDVFYECTVYSVWERVCRVLDLLDLPSSSVWSSVIDELKGGEGDREGEGEGGGGEGEGDVRVKYKKEKVNALKLYSALCNVSGRRSSSSSSSSEGVCCAMSARSVVDICRVLNLDQ